ncbi:MAG: hypothetical protein GC186_20530 [Rhodobacteraceae bacterium]|nr:hypothetical protein [Paracoccaceae bacterium]
MVRFRNCGAVITALFLFVPQAQAGDLVEYSQVGVWDVMVDPSTGNGCLITADFDDGSEVRIGLDRDQGNGYVMAMNDAWGDITDDATYDISFAVDNQRYNGKATGVHLDDLPGVDIPVGNADFFGDLAQKSTLTLYAGHTEVMKIDLTDAGRAMEGLIACQKAQG